MMKLKNELDLLSLPEFISREHALKMLKTELFGNLTDLPKIINHEILFKKNDYISNVVWEKICLTVRGKKGDYKFSIDIAYPKNAKKLTTFLHISFITFEDSEKEIIETVTNKNAIFVNVYYKSITEDNNDFNSGICSILDVDFSANDRPGKISIWANTLIAIIDLISTFEIVDCNKICVVGHSRLGKTALWAGALDERIYMTVSNNSGASGAALARKNTGEKISDITRKFPFWFANNYKKYSDNEEAMPFDQHFLLSLVAPRILYVSSASLDKWACPKNEFLCTLKASETYAKHGLPKLTWEGEFPHSPFECNSKNIGYHMREGIHNLTKYDWEKFVNFVL